MANPVKCLLEVNEVVVKGALVLWMFCKYDPAVEDLFNCTPSCSEACSTLLGWLVKLMVLQSWHCLMIPFFGRGITSDLVHSVGYVSVPRSTDIDMLVLLLFLPSSTLLLISSEGMSSIPSHLPVFTAASTSPSVPVDCPHFQWRTGLFVVWNRRCLIHICTRQRSIMPTSSALQRCL